MNTEIQLNKDMSIYADDNSKVGNLRQVVIDPVTSKITHVVVEQGFIFTTDKVLPIDYIARQEGDSLYLDRSSKTLNLPDFEETYYVSQTNPEVVVEEDDFVPDSVYYYPPMLDGGVGMYYWGLPPYLAGDPMKAITRRNIPDDSALIEEGAKVYSLDGDHVGEVYSVHMDGANKRITHFIISQGLLFHDYKLIPVFWVNQVDEDGIRVAVNTAQLEKLPAYNPEKS